MFLQMRGRHWIFLLLKKIAEKVGTGIVLLWDHTEIYSYGG